MVKQKRGLFVLLIIAVVLFINLQLAAGQGMQAIPSSNSNRQADLGPTQIGAASQAADFLASLTKQYGKDQAGPNCLDDPLAENCHVDGDLNPEAFQEAYVAAKEPPTLLKQFKNRVRDVAAGGFHTLLLDTDGVVWAFGIGSGSPPNAAETKFDAAHPKRVVAIGQNGQPIQGANIVQIAGGGYFSLLLDDQGRVFSFGRNRDMAPRNPLSSSQSSSSSESTTSPEDNHHLDSFEQVFAFLVDTELPPIVNISAGYQHALALDQTGVVWLWGDNSDHQIAGHNLPFVHRPFKLVLAQPISQISAGGQHSLLLTRQGQVWTFGSPTFGSLGVTVDSDDPHTIQQAKQTNEDKHGHADLWNVGLENIVAISAGGDHNLVVDADGTVFAWGWNDFGQCGSGKTSQEEPLPQPISSLPIIKTAVAGKYGHSLFLGTDNELFGAGWNEDGQLALEHELYPVPHRVYFFDEFASILKFDTGYKHTVLMTQDANVFVFGDSTFGQLSQE